MKNTVIWGKKKKKTWISLSNTRLFGREKRKEKKKPSSTRLFGREKKKKTYWHTFIREGKKKN